MPMLLENSVMHSSDNKNFLSLVSLVVVNVVVVLVVDSIASLRS